MNFTIDGRNLALLIWVVSLLLGALASLENSPKIITKDGNVVLEAGINKNITIRLPGRSRLVVNDLDLMNLLLGGGSGISNFTSPMPIDGVSLRILKEDVETLKYRLFGRGGLSTRLARLQNRTSMSNPSNVLRRTQRRVSIINSRVQNLLRTLNMDHCKSNPCENGGTCFPMFDGFLCKCTKGYEGLTCSADVNECALFAGTDIGCQNGAQCINQFGTYSCICNSGWQGIHCSQRKTDCLHSSNLELCGHGTCVNTNDNFGYRCICEQGWKSNGLTPSCNVDVDECKDHTNPCTTKCINLPGGFVCAPCDAGYTGNGLSCRDIDECATNNGGCSVVPFAHCINSYGSFHCGECPVGWTGDGRVCTRNVNQQSCAMNNICHSLALCQEVSNRIICSCPVGLTGNGVGPNGCYSLGTNMCSSNPCLNGGSCMDIGNGSYTCLCPIGYRLPNCVQSFNQCAPNPCRNGGTCHPHGVTFTCSCITGYGGRLCDSQRSRCGQFMSAEQGNLKYPLNDLYSHNAQCSWVIRTNETKVLNITFSKFEIEDAVDCRFDWLQMHDGPTAASQLFGRFCGLTAPLGGNIITTTNQIYLWFKSDNSTAKAGFDLSWSSIDPICGGVIEFDSHTTIASPGSPGNYPRNRDCKWHLKAPNNKRIKLVFFSLKIEKHSTCNHDYLEVTDAISMSQLEIFCNSSNPAPFTVPSNEIIVHFHSDNEGTDLGFQIHVSTVERVPGCGGTYTDRNGLIVSPTDFDGSMSCEYVVHYPKGLRVQLEMNKFEMGDGDCIEIFDVNAGTKVSTGRWCGKMSVPIFKSAGNEVQINYYSKGGTFKMSYGTICEYTFEDSSGVITSPNYPSPYPSDETCTYEIIGDGNQVVSIEFTDMDLESHEGINACWFDYVSIADGNNETAAGPYCGTTMPPKFVSSASFMKLTLRTDRNGAGRGFKVNYTLIDTGSNCGGILKKLSAEIRLPSDSSSGHYQNDLECIWTIIAPAGYGIQLSWLSFQVEYSTDCIFDYVEIYSTEKITSEGAVGHKFCGLKVPPAIVSAANVLTLKFVSDSADSDDGFVARYNFVDVSSLCGGVIFASTGQIKSTNWPNPYPNNLNCSWSLSVQTGHQIELIVKSMDLEESEGCQNDWIELRNGGSESSPLIGKYCGQTIPRRIPSFTHQIHVHFRTDSQISKNGFHMEWQTVSSGCGGVISADHGSVASPFYPQYYSNDAQCEWKISVNKGSTIIITIEDLSLESLFSCAYDFVEIYDGPTVERRKIGRYCEKPNDSSFRIETTGSDALIRFQSDSSNTDRGFYLSYASNCNHVLNATFGAIESPNLGNNNPTDVNCNWTIRAPKGNKIVLNFAILGRKDSDSDPEYVYMKESDNDTVIPITNQGRIESHGNSVQVWLNSSSVFFRLEYTMRGCVESMSRPRGEFSSPGYPNTYPNDIECIWSIETEIGNAIELYFTNIDTEDTVNCTNDGIKVWNTAHRGHLIAKFCGKLDNITVSSSGHTMFVEFFSSKLISGRGFKANYTTYPSKCGGKYNVPQGSIHSPNYPENYDSNLHCEWLIQVSEHSTMSLTLEEVDIEESHNCLFDSLSIYSGNQADEYERKVFCGDVIPTDNVIHTTSNTAMLVFDTDSDTEYKGFKVSFKENCGKRIIVNDTGRIRFSGSDQKECLWVFVAEDMSKHVTFTTTHIQMTTLYNLAMVEGIDCHGVKIFDGDFTNTTEIHPKEVFCSKHPPASTSLGHALTIQLDTNVIDAFEGFYSIMDNSCGGKFTSRHGTFASPSYPIAYPVNIECVWEIVASDGNSLTLTIQRMEIDKTEGCNDDYLEVRERNSTGRLIGVFCGDDVPGTLTTQNSFWIKFNSDNDNVGKGFIAEYSYALHTELNGTGGIIESPQYPSLFTSHTEYSWRISVPRGNLIMVTFDYFLPDFKDLTKIYNGYDDQAEAIEYDGSNIARSETNVLNIRSSAGVFRLHWYRVSKDFMATNKTSIEESSCSNKIIAVDIAPIMFQSPGYPNGYDSNLNCSWIIVAVDQGKHAAISFLRIDLEDMNNCAADRVVIYSSIDMTNWKELDTKCKMKSDSILQFSSDRYLKVEFLTDYGVNKTGFTAKAAAICGSTLTDPVGFINSTSYTSQLFYAMGCTWKIQVKVGRRIKITFIESELRTSSSDPCRTYVLLKNGISEHSPNLGSGKYCDSGIPDIPITSSNTAYVKFYFERLVFAGPKISFKYEEVMNECSHRIDLDEDHSSVIIKSENYPNIPHAHTMCVWIIRAPAHRLVAVNFLSPMNLKRTALCESEYVELGDGITELSPVIARFCGDKIPNTQYSSGNTLRITHFTDIAEPNIGFSANVSLGICGGTYRELNGTISSPKVLGANAMKTNITCDYTILLPESNSVNLTVNRVDLPWSDNCSEVNHLRISSFDKESEVDSEPMIVCGQSAPVTYLIYSNNIQISYQILSPEFEHNTFQIAYFAVGHRCGQTFEAESGILMSPGYLSLIETPTRCSWKVRVPKGRRIKIEFVEYNVADVPISNNRIGYRIPNQLVLGNDFELRSIIARLWGNPPSILYSSDNLLTVMSIETPMSQKQGFKLKYSSDEESIFCNANFDRVQDEIHFQPPSNSSVYCRYNIRVRHNETIALTVSKIESDSNLFFSELYICTRHGALTLQDMSGNSRMNWFCGNRNESTIRLPYPFMLDILSNTHNKLRVLDLKYARHNCGGEFAIGNEFRLSQPSMLTTDYGAMDCAWRVLPNPGDLDQFEVSLSVDFKLKCDEQYLVLYADSNRDSPHLSRFCNKDTVDSLISTKGLFIEYHTSNYEFVSSFNLTATVGSGCGGDLSYPFRPIDFRKQYQNNVECIWTIRAPKEYHISLKFSGRFFIESSVNCTKDYILIEQEVSPNEWRELQRICGREPPVSVNTTTNVMRFIFRSDDSGTGDGFTANFERNCGGVFNATKDIQQLVSPNYPLPYDYNSICHYTIYPSEPSKSILIQITDFMLENSPTGECEFDNLTVYVKSQDPVVLCGHDHREEFRSTEPIVLIFKSDNSYSRKGFRLQYSDEMCGGYITNTTAIATPKQIADSSYPSNLECVWNITAPEGSKIVVKFENFEFEGAMSCSYDFVQLFSGKNPSNDQRVALLCGNLTGKLPPFSIKSNFGIIQSISDQSMPSVGFSALVVITKNCDKNIELKDLTDVYTFDDYATGYDNELDCDIVFRTAPGRQLVFEFSSFHLEESQNCDSDYVQFRDGGGPFADEIGRFCGHEIPNPVMSSRSTLYMRFVSDTSETSSGFSATVKAIALVCGSHELSIKMNESVTISSGEGEKYLPNMNCFWRLRSDSNIRLDFVKLDIQDPDSNGTCTSDYLKIFNKQIYSVIANELGSETVFNGMEDYLFGEAPTTHHVFCGQGAPEGYYTNNKEVFIKFVTDSRIEKTGFKMIATAMNGCYKNFNTTQGRIFMDTAADCSIYINAPSNYTISVYSNYMYFFAGTADSCSSDFIEVIDNRIASNSTKLQKFPKLCGSVDPSNSIFSNSNKLRINLIHNSIYSNYDFTFLASNMGPGCGGELFNVAGIFTSPFYPENVRNDSDCYWHIRVPNNMVVSLDFKVFDLGSKVTCRSDYLEVMEYESETRYTTTRKFCGEDTPKTYKSQRNILMVRFHKTVNFDGTGWVIAFSGVRQRHSLI